MKTTVTGRRVSILALALLLAGCGGGGGDDDRLTAEEFATRANGTCAALQGEVVAAFADLPPDGDPTLYQGPVRVLAGLVDRALEDLEELRPPAEVEERYEEALDALRGGNERVRQAGETPEASAAIFAGDDDPYDAANAILDELGLSECGSSGGDESTP